jgi:hypothetical protein
VSWRDLQQPPEASAKKPNARASPRAQLAIPVQAKIGLAPSRKSRLYDVSVSGFRIDWPDKAEVGETIFIRFRGYPKVCPAFILQGQVARVVTGDSPGLGVAINRESSSPEALDQFRRLVLHYMHHKPLLDELAANFFEGRCVACDWVGHVGTLTPVCPLCTGRVEPLDPGQ